MVYFKENYILFRFQRGSNIFQGEGVQLFPGVGGGEGRGGWGVRILISIEIYRTCDFPAGYGPPIVSPLWIRSWLDRPF